MATVIVIGVGLGGMSAAYELKAELGKLHEVILVNDKPDFKFTPSNPWIVVQWRKRKETSIPIEPHAKKKGIRFIHAALTELQPATQQLSLSDGQTLRYYFLAICTGPALDFDEVTGAGPESGGTTSVCTLIPRRRVPPQCQRAGQRARSGDCRCHAWRLLLRPGLRVRLHPRSPSARQESEKKCTHDLCHQRALHRPSES